MKLADLNDNETLALVALLREVVAADGQYTDEEREQVDAARDGVGAARFAAAIERAKKELPTRAELKEFVVTLDRQDAKQLIWDFLAGAAAADGEVAATEEKPLRWLLEHWKVSAT